MLAPSLLALAAAPLLTAETFKPAVTSSPHFLMFYAPWCGHCKKFLPAWDTFADDVNPTALPDQLRIAKVDCVADTAVCSAAGVQGYPTLRMFIDGKPAAEEYTGGRSSEALAHYVSEQNGALASRAHRSATTAEVDDGVHRLTDANFAKFTASGVALVKFYAPWCGHCKKLAPVWEDFGRQLHGHVGKVKVTVAELDCIANKGTCAEQGVRGYPTILAYREGAKVEKYAGERTVAELTAFASRLAGGIATVSIETDQHGVSVLGPTTFEIGVGRDWTFVKFYAPWCGHCKAMAPEWVKLSEAGVPRLTVAEVDCTGAKALCDEQGVLGFPTLLLYNDGAFVNKYKGARKLGPMEQFVRHEMLKHKHSEL